MNREIHKIYDAILKLIILSYPDEFLSYLGVEKSIKQILHTEIITKKGRQLYLDFLCQLEDNTLLNIEFQFTVLIKMIWRDFMITIFIRNVNMIHAVKL